MSGDATGAFYAVDMVARKGYFQGREVMRTEEDVEEGLAVVGLSV